VGQLDYEANHAFISDNLLDLSHLAFLHEKTLGRRPDSAPKDGSTLQTRTGAEAKPLERGVRAESWRVGEQNRSVIQPTNAPKGDVWTRVDFLVPGIFISRVATYPAGTAQACAGGTPGDDMEALTDTMSCQAVTPMTARTTRYFYSSGPRASDMSEEESRRVWEIAEAAFLEDKVMIEAQQKVIDHCRSTRMGWIEADRGPGLFRALMERLIAAETSPSATAAGNSRSL
jgi:vanillate O-demethylase monooxygenase subunit